jgi:hypothetical protein
MFRTNTALLRGARWVSQQTVAAPVREKMAAALAQAWGEEAAFFPVSIESRRSAVPICLNWAYPLTHIPATVLHKNHIAVFALDHVHLFAGEKISIQSPFQEPVHVFITHLETEPGSMLECAAPLRLTVGQWTHHAAADAPQVVMCTANGAHGADGAPGAEAVHELGCIAHGAPGGHGASGVSALPFPSLHATVFQVNFPELMVQYHGGMGGNGGHGGRGGNGTVAYDGFTEKYGSMGGAGGAGGAGGDAAAIPQASFRVPEGLAVKLETTAKGGRGGYGGHSGMNADGTFGCRGAHGCAGQAAQIPAPDMRTHTFFTKDYAR